MLRGGRCRTMAMVGLVAGAGLLLLVPSSAAWSLAPAVFDRAVWSGPDEVVAEFGFDVVSLDLSSGEMTVLYEGVVSQLAADPFGPRVALVPWVFAEERVLEFHDRGSGGSVSFDEIRGPFAASPAGVVWGTYDLGSLSFHPWQDPENRRVVETGLVKDYDDSRVQSALSRNAELFAFVAQDEAQLRFVDMENGGHWPGLDSVSLSLEPLEERPAVQFSSDGSFLGVLFTVDGKDRLVGFDMTGAREPQGLLVSPAARDTPLRSLAWTETGVVVAQGDRVRFVEADRVCAIALEGDATAANVVADPDGSSFVVFVRDIEQGHGILHFDAQGRPLGAWRQDEDEQAWVSWESGYRFEREDSVDPAWSPPVKGEIEVSGSQNGPEKETVPAPATAAGMLVFVAGAYGIARRRQG